MKSWTRDMYITLPFLNSKDKIIGGGGLENTPPQSLLDKSSPIRIGLSLKINKLKKYMH